MKKAPTCRGLFHIFFIIKNKMYIYALKIESHEKNFSNNSGNNFSL
jgi:hypothetical protein